MLDLLEEVSASADEATLHLTMQTSCLALDRNLKEQRMLREVLE